MNTEPAPYRVTLGDMGFLIGYLGSDDGYHLATQDGGANNVLRRLPPELRPDGGGYAYWSRVKARKACDWLTAQK